MKPKFMQLPRAVLVGEGVIHDVMEVCDDLNLGEKALVISGPLTYEIAGKTVISVFEKAVNYVIQEASMREVEKILEFAKKQKTDFMIGVGGGKVIDVAKLSSKMAGKEFVSIPTAASHDGIASSRASIKSRGCSVSIEAHAPIGVIADTQIIKNSPYKLLASGCGDIIAKYTAIKDWELANKVKKEEISEYAAALSRMTAKIIMDSCYQIKKRNEKSVRKVVKALISSGVAMSIAGSSRPGSGSEHKFCHALDMITPYPGLHGERCGLGAIMMMHLHEDDWKSIRNALKEVGAPTTAKELGIRKEYIIKALIKGREIRPHRYTILEHKPLDERSARNLMEETGII
jgi:glycerol-1-phosphate dehydrogenase [NAD(P)+]